MPRCSIAAARPQGENAWVFVHEDDIADAVKHWHAFAGDLEKEVGTQLGWTGLSSGSSSNRP
jgi:hypothetical protein